MTRQKNKAEYRDERAADPYGEAERMSAAGVEIQETTAADAAGIGRRPASAFWRPCSGRFWGRSCWCWWPIQR